MNFLREWITGIIVTIIINTIIELIIPEGKNKKYIRSIMGVYISFIIISPIFSKLTNSTFNLQNVINKYNYSNYVSVETSIDTNLYIEDIYISKLKEDIKKKLSIQGYEAKNITITIENENENTYGEILNLILEIDRIKNSTIEKIKKVDVNLEKSEVKETSNISEDEKITLKNYFNSIYGVDCQNIEIY